MHTDPGTPPSPTPTGTFAGARRSIAMAILAVGLLVVGGSAVALAADPTASPTPAATTAPIDPETTGPATDDSDHADRPGRPDRGDCPDAGGPNGAAPGSGGSTPGAGGSETTPDAATGPDDTTVPAPSIDASDV